MATTCQTPFQQQWKVWTAGVRGRQVVQHNCEWPGSSTVFSSSSFSLDLAAQSLGHQRLVWSDQQSTLPSLSASVKKRHSLVCPEICTRVQTRRKKGRGPALAQANPEDWGGDSGESNHEGFVSSTEQSTVHVEANSGEAERRDSFGHSEKGLDNDTDLAPQTEEQNGGVTNFLSGPLEWLHQQWDVPWGSRTTLAVFFGSQLLAGWVGQLAGNGIIYALGSEVAGTHLQRFCSRVAAYLSIAVILEVFLANQKRLKESPFEMSSGGRWWRHVKWVALWFGFRLLWGGVISRAVVLPRMCKPPSTFPIELLPSDLWVGWRGGSAVEGLSAATVASITTFAGPLNVALDLLVAPWFEEAFFRGCLQASLSKSDHPIMAILGTAILQGASFVTRTALCGVQPAMGHPPGLRLRWCSQSMLSAVVYGLVFQKTRSLVPGVLLHQLETLSRVLACTYERGPFWTTWRLAFLVLSSAGQ